MYITKPHYPIGTVLNLITLRMVNPFILKYRNNDFDDTIIMTVCLS